MPAHIDRLAFTGSRSAIWHGIGEELATDVSPSEAVRRILPWNPVCTPVHLPNGKEIPEFKANVRSDTGEVLGIVSSGYQIVRNEVLGDMAEAVVGADAAATADTCGSLLGGRKVFVLCRVPRTIVVGKDDETVPYLLVANSHDGSTSFFALLTHIRVVCNNTLTMALSSADGLADSGRAFRFRHTGTMDTKIEDMRRVIGIATTQTERLALLYDRMAATSMPSDYFLRVWEDTEGKLPDPASTNEKHEQLRIRFNNRMALWSDALTTGTLWDAYNVVTAWHDHTRAPRVTGERRTHSNLIGNSALDKRRALRVAAGSLT